MGRVVVWVPTKEPATPVKTVVYATPELLEVGVGIAVWKMTVAMPSVPAGSVVA